MPSNTAGLNPEDLTVVNDAELQILDSQIKRQLDWEITNQGEPVAGRPVALR